MFSIYQLVFINNSIVLIIYKYYLLEILILTTLWCMFMTEIFSHVAHCCVEWGALGRPSYVTAMLCARPRRGFRGHFSKKIENPGNIFLIILINLLIY